MLHQVLLQISRINPVFIQELPFFKGDYSNLKSVMGLQDQVFKICKKGMQAYKEWGSNLDNILPKTEIPPSLYKIGGQV